MARGGKFGNKGGRKPGQKNKATGEFQKWYREMCQDVLKDPAVRKFYKDVVQNNPIERESFDVKDPKTGLYTRKVRLVRLDTKLRAEILRDLRDGSGCRPVLLLEGEKGTGGSDAKPSFNIAITVV